MSPEFRKGENPADIHLVCTECGGSAEGNHSWTDGSGDICDKCAAADAHISSHIPTRKGHFVKATNGANLHVWLCQNAIRAEQLFQEQVALHDPFANLRTRSAYLATSRWM